MNIPEYIRPNLLQEWVDSNDRKVTVEDILSAKKVDSLILLFFLKRVRESLHGDKAIAPRGRLHSTDEQLRADVRNHPSKYCFAYDALREYSPFTRGEIVKILLEKLQDSNIHVDTGDSSPAGTAEVSIAMPKDESET